MKRFAQFLVVLFLVTSTSAFAGSSTKGSKEVGLGMGGVSAYPVASFPSALMAVLEGTYRWNYFSLSILATAVSSPSINGTYWFGSQGGYQQTFIEPRLMLSILRLGFAVGLNLSSGTSGQIQSMASYGPMVGIQIPLGKVSLGVDARYLMNATGTNSTPLSAVFMFRFRL